ncbi:hypothetical protein BDN72DRAFT_831162 [Pluteus cervinus]|uniref:Uncharacterized protein n=1 Tax=Pluteus cervinus TaxID=181527 RepID=A0ACD3BEW8_9AGAR|nr:hypothetical protein BDN72DRAFT_831162 [Pluteus cervinus]
MQVVDLCHELEPRVWSQVSFGHLITRSQAGCALIELHLHNVLPSEDDLIQCLQWTSNSLIELRLSDLKGITVVMGRALVVLTDRPTTNGTSVCMCPKLEVLKLGTSLASLDGVLASMVESRWKPSLQLQPWLHWASTQCIACLQSINPRLDPSTHLEDIRRLALLREQGLELC